MEKIVIQKTNNIIIEIKAIITKINKLINKNFCRIDKSYKKLLNIN